MPNGIDVSFKLKDFKDRGLGLLKQIPTRITNYSKSRIEEATRLDTELQGRLRREQDLARGIEAERLKTMLEGRAQQKEAERVRKEFKEKQEKDWKSVLKF